MRIFAGGFPRSGTMSIARLFDKLGYKSIHLHDPDDPTKHRAIKNELAIKRFHIDKPPRSISRFAKHRKSVIKGHKNYFESDPYNALGFYYLKGVPGLRFLLMLRDPVSAANSFLNFRKGLKSRSNDINFYAKKWLIFHQNILEQIFLMGDNRPVILEFNRYINGDYNQFFIDITGKKDFNFDQFLSKKINTRGEYRVLEIEPDLLAKCNSVYRQIVGAGRRPCEAQVH